jgi:hypothetical protein
MLKALIKKGKWPKEWKLTFPNGYRVECRVVSKKYLDRLNVRAGGGNGGLKADALSFTFGDKIFTNFLHEKTGRVYFSEDVSMAEFCHIYFHEIHHQFIEWTGVMHSKLLDLIANGK